MVLTKKEEDEPQRTQRARRKILEWKEKIPNIVHLLVISLSFVHFVSFVVYLIAT